jgi:uncharacterized protein YecE (DUF72 family)
VLRIGTSGWQYADWRGSFYPGDAPSKEWLERYADHFTTVEVNNSFYRLPARETFERWARTATGRSPHFAFAVKASRFLTHVKRLREPAEPVARLVDAVRGLGPSLSVILLQLPPNLRCDTGRLDETLTRFPTGTRVAVEFRHESWFVDAVYRVLRAHDSALCLADRRNRHSPIVRTADWCYVRLHEGRARPTPCYGRAALQSWIARIAREWGREADGYVYFNNDRGGCAPANARTFRDQAERAGVEVT